MYIYIVFSRVVLKDNAKKLYVFSAWGTGVYEYDTIHHRNGVHKFSLKIEKIIIPFFQRFYFLPKWDFLL